VADRETKTFLDYKKLHELAILDAPTEGRLESLLAKALELRGLETGEAAELAAVTGREGRARILEAAGRVKREIYGRRLVLFAPLYTGNHCSNDCTYCGFRVSNRALKRVVLGAEEIRDQAELLLRQGHKRILVIGGESARQPLEHTLEAIASCYAARAGNAKVRRVNVEIAPLEVEGFRALKRASIGTYVCFQETYDPDLYRSYHPSGPKADYENRLYVMDRAQEGGCDDVGIGALFGLGPWRYEFVAMLEHARHLEESFRCGPHTVSVPRIEYAEGAPAAERVPDAVNDDDFKLLVALLRLALPYTGIILSTRERSELRDELFAYGVSQISAGSRTDPGGYGDEDSGEKSSGQFSLGDQRSLDEVIGELVGSGYVPSFCTGCYRQGRTGADFMDLAKPGLIKEYCLPNGLVSFAEYLHDYASTPVKAAGLGLIDQLRGECSPAAASFLDAALGSVASGERDLYL